MSVDGVVILASTSDNLIRRVLQLFSTAKQPCLSYQSTSDMQSQGSCSSMDMMKPSSRRAIKQIQNDNGTEPNHEILVDEMVRKLVQELSLEQ